MVYKFTSEKLLSTSADPARKFENTRNFDLFEIFQQQIRGLHITFIHPPHQSERSGFISIYKVRKNFSGFRCQLSLSTSQILKCFQVFCLFFMRIEIRNLSFYSYNVTFCITSAHVKNKTNLLKKKHFSLI